MEALLSKVTQQAMNYAIKTGITITSTYAIRQCGRLLKTVEGQERTELEDLRLRLGVRIRIISPAIDLIELISARGNTTLESAITLAKAIRYDIQTLGNRIAKAVKEAEATRKHGAKIASRAQSDLELKLIIADMKKLLVRIEDAVPLINLAITASGVDFSMRLPAGSSPSRLLQASTFLTAGDTQYNTSMPRALQIGPAFTLSVYMLFSGHANRALNGKGIRDTTWKEVMHKARVVLLRVPLDHVYDYPTPFEGNPTCADETAQQHIPSDGRFHEFAYQLLIVEDLDDDRVHTFDDEDAQPGPYEGVALAGIRELIPIHEISKIFYADTGQILNIKTDEEANSPVLLLKRDVNAIPPRRMMERTAVEMHYDSDDSHTIGGSEGENEQSELDEQLRRESTADLPQEELPQEDLPTHPWRLSPNLDLEWVAFEVYTEGPSSDSELEDSEVDLDIQFPNSESTSRQRTSSSSPGLQSYFSKLNLRPSTPPHSTPPPPNTQLIPSPQKKPPIHIPTTPMTQNPHSVPPIQSSLSLLEMLIRLTALQQFQQTSHLAIPDQLLTFFLSESSTVGAGLDTKSRHRIRDETEKRVGFDPYDESPIKLRDEEYVKRRLQEREHEHEQYQAYDDMSPMNDNSFDYEEYPHGKRGNSRSSTPLRSPSFMQSSPIPGAHKRSSADFALLSREDRSVGNPSSASGLLRRATTQPGPFKGIKQPSFRGPPTAPPTSSSPRVNQGAQAGRGSQIPGTPPSSAAKPS